MKKMYDVNSFSEGAKAWNDNFQKFYGGKEDAFKAWEDIIEKMYGTNEFTNSFGKNAFDLNEQKALLKKLFGSADVYSSLFTFWKNMNQNGPYDSPEKITDFCKNYRDAYMKTVSNMVKLFSTGEYAPVAEQYMDVCNGYISLFDKISMPWLENTDELKDVYKSMMSGDTNALKEYYNIVTESYNKSFGQFMNMSGLGIYKENFETQMQGVDAYVQFINIYNELMALVSKSFSDSMETVTSNYSALMNEDKQPKTFKEFYELWLGINENNLITLFGTEEFSKVYCKVAEKYCEFKIKFDKLAGLYLKVLPLPSKDDMDSLYKTVYDQKKEIKNLKAEISGLKSASSDLDDLKKEMSKSSNIQKEFADFKKSMSKKVEV